MNQIKISGFKNAFDRQPKPTTIGKWIHHYPCLVKLVNAIRNEKNPERIKELKTQLPAITPSGLFSGGRTLKHLVSYSKIICLDFDEVSDIDQAKQILSEQPFVYYAGLSAGGRGLYAYIPIKHPDKHKFHFRALATHFLSLGLTVDNSCSDVTRLRFYSYDLNPVFNPNPEQYIQHASEPEHLVYYEPASNGNACKIEFIINRIESMKTDVTQHYSDWFSICGALANEFGEAGRQYFHRISRFYPQYSASECNRQFNACMRNRKAVSINLFYHILKKYNLQIKEFSKQSH